MSGRLERAFSLSDAFGLICPHCGCPYERQKQSLICKNSHTVNGNRKGYFNFLSRPATETYGKSLFESRRRVFDSGLYDRVMSAIFEEIQSNDTVLDVGCGDGSYLNTLIDRGHRGKCAGVDMSREGIEMASSGNALWCVADMRHLPFDTHSFDIILDILSPADYEEFRRILKPSGKLIKVIPGAEYLQEIREARHLKGGESPADARLQMKMQIIKTKHIHETTAVNPELWPDILRMTPLNQDLRADELRKMDLSPSQTLTIDLIILCAVFDYPK